MKRGLDIVLTVATAPIWLPVAVVVSILVWVNIRQSSKPIRWTIYGFLGFIVLLTLLSSFYTVKSTERGVLSTFGKIQDKAIGDGLHMKIPYIQQIQKVNVQQKKFDGTEDSYTRDVQTSEVTYTINYDLVTENVSLLIKKVGNDYHTRIVEPYIRSAVKSSFGNFNATQIVENRDKVRAQIETKLRETLDKRYFTNIHFLPDRSGGIVEFEGKAAVRKGKSREAVLVIGAFVENAVHGVVSVDIPMGEAKADIVLECRAAAPGDGFVRFGRACFAHKADI